MQAARQFGRNISNVQHANINGKKATKTLKPKSQASGFSISQTKVTVKRTDRTTGRKRERTAPKSTSQSLFDNAAPSTEVNLDDSYLSDTDPMSIDLQDDIQYEDIDQFDTHDPNFVSEYITDIMAFLKEKELAVQISEDYCSKQRDIKPKQRNQLIRWMAEVYFQLKLLSETYFLAVNIVDQVLDACLVSRKKLHLIGVTALFVAAKYEETWAPPLSDLRICCNYAFSEDDITRMEREILNRINFNLCIPAPIHFLRRYSKAGHSDGLTHTIAKFLIEMTCQSYEMLRFLPSQVAAAAVLMARQIRGEYPELWDGNLQHYAGYRVEDLVECGHSLTNSIRRELNSGRSPCAVVRKYSEKKMYGVANIVAEVLNN